MTFLCMKVAHKWSGTCSLVGFSLGTMIMVMMKSQQQKSPPAHMSHLDFGHFFEKWTELFGCTNQ